MSIAVPDDFLNFLRQESESAVDPTLDDKRAVAIDAYQGQPYGDEVEGRSQAVTRDVSEVIDFMTVALVDTFLASGKPVEFTTEPEPATDEHGQPVMQAPNMPQDAQQGPQGQDGAPAPQAPPKPMMVDYGEEATASIKYQFMRKRPGYLGGYLIIHTATKAGLMEKSGIVKTYVEHQPPVHSQHDVMAGDIEVGEDGPHVGGVPVVDAQATDEGWQPGQEAVNWRVTLAHPQPPRFCDTPIPNEYFRVAPDAVDLDSAVYVGDRSPKTLSDLVALGYDRDELAAIWDNALAETVVQQSRDADRGATAQNVGARTGANKTLWLDEEYPLYDLDGDGIAERLFVHRIGDTILKVMPVDEQPYSLWSPFPMPHRLIGQSMYDKTGDIQRIRTVLLRQGLDSMYIANSPRTLVDESSITIDTIDDLLTVRPGGLVRYKGTAPVPLAQTDASAAAFQGMEMMSAERESRTGVTRQSQGLNPDTMNKTAAGLAMNMASSQQIELYVTRNLAEQLIAPMFAKRYRLMRKYGQPFRMKIEGEYRNIDPRKWPEEIDMSITIGLGTGDQTQRLVYRMQLLGIQKEGMAAGLPMFQPKHVYNNVRALVNESNLGTPSDFIADPDTLPPQSPRPDPEMEKVQGEAMLKQQAEENAHQRAMAQLSITQQQHENEAQIKSQAAAVDLETKRDTAERNARLADAKALKEAQLADSKQAFEQDLAERRFAFDQEMAKRKHDAMVAGASESLPANREGGSLAE
jgi:hypothetical protein